MEPIEPTGMTDMKFQLDERLIADCVDLMDYPLSKVLMLKDANFPRLVLVPRVAGAVELFDLTTDQQNQLMQEISLASQRLKQAFDATKINVGAIGNMVSQLHVHIVARFDGDPCWPKTMWDYPKGAYPEGDLETWAEGMKNILL